MCLLCISCELWLPHVSVPPRWLTDWRPAGSCWWAVLVTAGLPLSDADPAGNSHGHAVSGHVPTVTCTHGYSISVLADTARHSAATQPTHLCFQHSVHVFICQLAFPNIMPKCTWLERLLLSSSWAQWAGSSTQSLSGGQRAHTGTAPD